MKQTIILEKINEVGNKQIWEVDLNENTITTTWGIENGKMQTETQVVKEWKNKGRSNETDPAENAYRKISTRARNKIDAGGYKLIQGKLWENKEYRSVNNEIPKPMLACKFDDRVKYITPEDKLFINPKLDGFRGIFDRNTRKLYSRSRKEIVSVPHLNRALSEATKNLSVQYVDCELYSHDMPFNQVQSLLGKTKNVDEEKALKISAHVFDCMSDEVFEERYKEICKIQENDHVEIVPAIETQLDTIRESAVQYIDDGYEGIMIRLNNKPYEYKRSSDLLKYKLFSDEEFECVGYESQKNNENKVGAFTFITEDGKEFKARPKMSEEERDGVWQQRDSYIGQWGKVVFQEKSEDNIPRFPVLISFREDWDK